MRRLALLAAALLILAGCTALETSYTGNPTGRKLAMLGDSITCGLADCGGYGDGLAHRQLDPTYQVMIDAQIGLSTEDALKPAEPLLGNVLADPPAILVVNLGTNQDADDLAAAWQLLAARVVAADPTVCLIPVTVNVAATTFDGGRYDNTRAAALNDWLRATFPIVADWAPIANLYTGTDVHPTDDAGRLALVGLIAEAAARCPVVG